LEWNSLTHAKLTQDLAAGGNEFRKLKLRDGTIVTASVSLRSFTRSKELWAYMQFKVNLKTVTKYIGKVSADSRFESLRLGWAAIHSRKIAELNDWRWLELKNVNVKKN